MTNQTMLAEVRSNGGLGGLSAAARDVLAERRRQIDAEGWTPEHDDEHDTGAMAYAGAAYAIASVERGDSLHVAGGVYYMTRWEKRWFKPKNPRADLIRAAALLLAEIERLDRASGRG